MSPTLEYPYRVSDNRGNKRTKNDEEVCGVNNPLVGCELSNWLDEAQRAAPEDWYALAYLLDEYGGQALEEVEDAENDELEQVVVEIEERRSSVAVEHKRNELNKIIGQADPDELDDIKQSLKSTVDGDGEDEDGE